METAMTELTDAEVDAAARRGEQLATDEPRAKSAHFDAQSGRVVVELTNGCTFAFPARALQGLAEASDEELADVEVLGSGYGLHWQRLDADFSVPGLMMGVFGAGSWLARERARQAGQTTSVAKAAAARRNGAKGGRPRRKLA
jgi:hypothetical protein